jgi:hypothetical protein
MERMIALDGGEFLMGSADRFAYPADGEGPVRHVRLDPFWIDACAVSNDAFAKFAAATAHVTEAERFGWSFVFAGLLPDDFPPTRAVMGAAWWRQVEGASWRQPEGPGSDLEGRMNHPVLHVSFNDAQAYCAWVGKRLPDRGGVGVCGSWRPRRRAVPVGRRARAGRRAPHECVPGHVPGTQHVRGRLRGDMPGGRVSARNALTPDSTTGNTGFRGVRDA